VLDNLKINFNKINNINILYIMFNKYYLYLIFSLIIIFILYSQYNKIDENFTQAESENFYSEEINGKKRYFINECDKKMMYNDKKISGLPNWLNNEMQIDENYFKMHKKDTMGNELIRLCNTNNSNECIID
jgi:hypothetical protein